ncbi:MAG: hypothetical protein HC874_26195 [Richelia sp. SL_2_1]|nr:hypothetical protein [Richelia sp. SL_2_1]
MQKRLANAEIVKIPVSTQPLVPENSLMKFAGIFQDDPDFLEIMQQMRAERELDSDQ